MWPVSQYRFGCVSRNWQLLGPAADANLGKGGAYVPEGTHYAGSFVLSLCCEGQGGRFHLRFLPVGGGIRISLRLVHWLSGDGEFEMRREAHGSGCAR